MLLGFDFESYYDTDYSLTKMDPPCYILDKRWEAIGCAMKINEEPSFFVDAPDIGAFFATLDPAKVTTYAFNAMFDNCIAAWHYGFVPSRMLCTMRMAAACRGAWLSSVSLRNVGRYLGIGEKGTTIENARGLHRRDLMANSGLWRAYQAYAINDDEMSHDILIKLLPEFPSAERRVMDKVTRCAVVPRFQVNTTMLREHLEDLHIEKAQMLIDAGADTYLSAPDMEDKLQAFAKTLRSNGQFQAVLEARGIDIEYKQSVTNPEVKIPAFAKTDDFMAALQEHPDPEIQALACARLGLRSTIEESRGNRMLRIAELPWENHYRDGNGNFWSQYSIPMPLKYAAAHTHRLGGDWSLNVQNFPAGRGTQKSKLRKALVAPPGYKVVVADKSQIECRINGWLCRQGDLLDIFRANGDPYSVLASAIFGFKVDKKVHLIERFIGKGGVLGLGFGCGAEKFYNMVLRQARTLGMNMRELLKVWTMDLSETSVRIYRNTNYAIVGTWRQLDGILATAWLGTTGPVKFGPCVIGKGYVEGPNGLRMNYANPRRDEMGEYWFDYGRRTHKLYGAKFLENIVQFLARIDTMNDALRISDRTKVDFCLQSHDELAWIVPEADAANHLAIAIEEMRRPPSWAKDLPLNAEGNFGDSYGDAK